MSNTIDIPDLPNLQQPAPGFACGGQPDPGQLTAAASAGVRNIINLRPPSEDHGYDEPAKAEELGLDYTVLPIAGGADLNRENAAKLDALLADAGDKPTLIHCASGNRVGALMALRAAWVQGKDKTAALETGRCWGLTKLQPMVDKLLS